MFETEINPDFQSGAIARQDGGALALAEYNTTPRKKKGPSPKWLR